MKMYIECIPCYARQTIEAAVMVTDDPVLREKIIRAALRKASEVPFDKTPTHMGMEIHRIIRKLVGDIDPYFELKDIYNRKALELYPYMKKLVDKSPNRLETSVRLAIAGNIIDFGISHSNNEIKLKKIITETMKKPFAVNDLSELINALEDAHHILYIADNAGEIVFDRVFVEEIPDHRVRVTFAVKGHHVLNDATMKDALDTGLTDVVRVIDNGSDAPGTILETCSKQFQDTFKTADLVIAKGQGNYETLSNSGGKCFFLLKAKCSVIARHFGVEVGNIIVKKEDPPEKSS